MCVLDLIVCQLGSLDGHVPCRKTCHDTNNICAGVRIPPPAVCSRARIRFRAARQCVGCLHKSRETKGHHKIKLFCLCARQPPLVCAAPPCLM